MPGKKWTSTEDEFIRQNYLNMSSKQIAEKIDRTENAVTQYAKQLGIKKQNYRPWTEEENEFIRQNYLSMSWSAIGKVLGRKMHDVANKANKLGLKKPKSEWSKKAPKDYKLTEEDATKKAAFEKKFLQLANAYQKNIDKPDWKQFTEKVLEFMRIENCGYRNACANNKREVM